ncbi:MAG: NADH-quinone oxidoreductase subunit NuoE [Bacteroidales bacterium]|nr:NADH-quinone oxidoreductase subunit NuoE [Bacteroidales bacterium]
MEDKYIKMFEPFSGSEEELIPLLQCVQENNGFISSESIKSIARFARVAESKVFGVATFYAQFRFKPKGRNHIMVCRGTACHVKGAPRIVDELETQLGVKEGETSVCQEYSLESVACIGACSLAPCIMNNGKVEANLTPDKIQKLFRPVKKK